MSVPFIDDLIADAGGDEWLARAKYRALSRRSLYFHVKSTICWDKVPNLMTPRTFKGACDWVQNTITKAKRGLYQDPRNHAKSTIANEGLVTWIAIQCPHEDYDHPNEIARAKQFLEENKHIKGPDTRIVVACESKDIAGKKWGTVSIQHWNNNLVLRWAFPELIWDNPNVRSYGHWSETAYSLPGRKFGTMTDDFFRVLGIKSRASGGRADVMIIDDLVSEESNQSPTELAYRCDWLRSITQLLEDRDQTSPSGSAVLYINNHWNFNDPNTMVHDELPNWAIWNRAAWVCGVHGRGNCGRHRTDDPDIPCTPTDEPIWPERHRDLDAIRQDLGDVLFFTQWGNNPRRKVELDPEKLIPFRMELMAIDGKRQWCVVVDAKQATDKLPKRDREVIPISQLHGHTIEIDPAGADEESEARKRGKTCRWSASWYALDPPTARVFTLDERTDHWPPSEAIEEIYQMWKLATANLQSPVGLGCEKVATQTVVGAALKFRAQADGVQLPKVEMRKKRRGINKDVNIVQTFGTALGQLRWYVREGLIVPYIETRNHPTGSKDWLDTAAQVTQKYNDMMGANPIHGEQNMKRRMAVRRRRVAMAGAAGV